MQNPSGVGRFQAFFPARKPKKRMLDKALLHLIRTSEICLLRMNQEPTVVNIYLSLSRPIQYSQYQGVQILIMTQYSQYQDPGNV